MATAGAARQMEQYCSWGSRGLVWQPRGDSEAVVIAMREWQPGAGAAEGLCGWSGSGGAAQQGGTAEGLHYKGGSRG